MIQNKLNTQECPCGEMLLPSGSYMSVTPKNTNQSVFLVHNQNVHIKSQETFTTTSNFLDATDPYTPESLELTRTDGEDIVVNNVVQLRVLEYPTRTPVHVGLLGNFGYSTNFGKSLTFDLGTRQDREPSAGIDPNVSYIFEFKSLCDFGITYDPCCDSLPDSIPVDGYLNVCIPLQQYYDLARINPVTTTTLPPSYKGELCFGNTTTTTTTALPTLPPSDDRDAECIPTMLEVSVEEIDGANRYIFTSTNGADEWNGDKILKLKKGLYYFLDIPEAHPIAFLNGKGVAQNNSTGGSLAFAGESGKYVEREVDGITYRFWWGTLGVSVDEMWHPNSEIDFGTLSYYCAYHGYMGGENSVQYDADC